MKFLFSSRPAYGHLYPMMPLALAAREAGHDVVFATGRQFSPKLRALKFPTFVAGISIEEGVEQVVASGVPMFGKDGRTDMDFGGRVFIDTLARLTADDLLPVLQHVKPDIVIYEQGDVGAAVAAHVAGVPAICHSISPQMPVEVRELIGGARFDRLWGDFGIRPAPFDAFIGESFIDIFPRCIQEPSFADDPARVPMRPIPWAEPGFGLPAIAGGARRRPLVYLTLGTIVASDEVLRPAIDGLASLDADVIVALGSATGDDIGAIPENVHLETFVDQAGLMAHVDLVVHHGGSGTILAALSNGVSQVLMPKGADQFANADRMVAAGLASVILPSDSTPDAVSTAAKVALVEPDRAALDAVRADIAAMPDPVDVVGDLAARFG